MEIELFAPSELPAINKVPEHKEKCGQCEYIQRWRNEYVSPSHQVNFYCGITRSNRTENKLLKVKCKTPACDKFKEGE